jgi:heptosyltransferase-2
VKLEFHAARLLSSVSAALKSRPAERTVGRVLVIGYGAIGDTLFFLPTLEALRAAYPAASFTWLSNPAPVADELIPATGLVDDVWTWDASEDDADINRRVRAEGFDLAVLTLGAPAHHFLASLAGIPVVAGHRRPWRGLKSWAALGDYARAAVVNRAAPVVAGEHALARNLRLLAALGVAAPPSPRPRIPLPASAPARARGLLSGLPEPLVALHLGPTGNQYGKMWSPERFAALAFRLKQAWGGSLILVGSKDEAAAEKIFRASGGTSALSLIGKTDLLETCAVLERCALLIANDTGVAKAAALFGTPTATLWGPSAPEEFRAPWDPERHLDVRTGLSCSPCTWMGTPARSYNYTNCVTRDCLSRLEVDAAAAAILRRWPRPIRSGAPS